MFGPAGGGPGGLNAGWEGDPTSTMAQGLPPRPSTQGRVADSRNEDPERGPKPPAPLQAVPCWDPTGGPAAVGGPALRVLCTLRLGPECWPRGGNYGPFKPGKEGVSSAMPGGSWDPGGRQPLD